MNSLPLDMRIWRATYRLTQVQAADEASVSLSSWKRYEQGAHTPHPDWQERVRYTISRPPYLWRREVREALGDQLGGVPA
jgi:hypothetical protein